MNKVPWWKKTIVYQIYPRSFQDSNHDGIGDINGIISRLDYVKGVGIETIWISPFFKSPQEDFGYDISDYRSIDPEYGDMNSCAALIEECHKRDLKIIFDLVMNHTSDRHPWFVESKSSRNNKKRDWYLWMDGTKPKGKAPPNNWLSYLGGSGWNYDEATEQWYWSSFLPFQPDLNYRNPDVKEAMLDNVRFWLDKGVDGFRLDIFDALFKDPDFRDNPIKLPLFGGSGTDRFFTQKRVMNHHHPDTIVFAKELRRVVDEYDNPERFLVGEVSGDYETIRRYCGDDTPDGLQSVFLFQTLDTKLQAQPIRNLLTSFEHHFPEPFIPTWVFSNHDRKRRAAFLGNDARKVKLNAAFQLTVRGIPFIYYGEEIGMDQGSIPFDDALDPIASRFRNNPKVIQNFITKLTHGAVNRDNCRTPMQWNDSSNGGFCTEVAKPWLPVNGDYLHVNVNKQKLDQNSIYHCYRRFITARNEVPALREGALELIPEEKLPKTVLGYHRAVDTGGTEGPGSSIESTDGRGVPRKVSVYLNCGFESVTVTLQGETPELIVSTEAAPGKIEKADEGEWEYALSSFEGVVIA